MTLEDGDEDVEGIEDADDNQEDDDGVTLPGIVDAETKEEYTDDELDQCRYGDIGHLAGPFKYESLVSVFL